MCCRWGLGPGIPHTHPWNVLANARARDDTLRIESVAILPFPAAQPTIISPGARLSLCLSAEQLPLYAGDFLPGDTCWGENPSWGSAMTTFSVCGAPLWFMAANTFISSFFSINIASIWHQRPSLTAHWLATCCQESQNDFPLDGLQNS